MTRGAIWFVGWLGIFASVFSTESLGKGRKSYIPTARQHEALERGRDCSSFRALLRQSEVAMTEKVRQLNEQLRVLKGRRAELDSCARAKGIHSWEDDEDADLLAEVCPEAYAQWLEPSASLEMFREDIDNEGRDSDRIRTEIAYRCKAIPREAEGSSKEGSL